MSSGDGPRSIPSVMTSMFERATRKWTRQRRSEERHPGNVRYRVSRMTKVARITQKEVAWAVMEQCYRAVSGLRNLPAKVREIFYRARPTRRRGFLVSFPTWKQNSDLRSFSRA